MALAGRNAAGPTDGGRLHEVRTTLADGTIARTLICFHRGELYALHGFIKKTPTTPKTELAIARRRQKDIDHD